MFKRGYDILFQYLNITCGTLESVGKVKEEIVFTSLLTIVNRPSRWSLFLLIFVFIIFTAQMTEKCSTAMCYHHKEHILTLKPISKVIICYYLFFIYCYLTTKKIYKPHICQAEQKWKQMYTTTQFHLSKMVARLFVIVICLLLLFVCHCYLFVIVIRKKRNTKTPSHLSKMAAK